MIPRLIGTLIMTAERKKNTLMYRHLETVYGH